MASEISFIKKISKVTIIETPFSLLRTTLEPGSGGRLPFSRSKRGCAEQSARNAKPLAGKQVAFQEPDPHRIGCKA